MRYFFSSFLFISTMVFGGERGWNSLDIAKIYFHHSEIQRGWAWELIGQFPFHEAKQVLDFGCGDGKITAELARLTRSGNVTGVDLSNSMIELANIHFPKSSYGNLTFQQIDSTLQITGLYDVICAFSVFHFLDQPVEILKSLHTHLTADGHLLLTIPFTPPLVMRQAANEILAKYGLEQPWHRPNYSSKLSMRTVEGCKEKLQEAGYEILLLETIETPNVFHDLAEFVNWLIGTASANWGVPLEIGPSFFTEVTEKMIEIDPGLLDDRGCFVLPQTRIHVIAKKGPSFPLLPAQDRAGMRLKALQPGE